MPDAPATAPASPTPPPAPTPPPPPPETPSDELIELMLEEGKPAVKVPRSKLDPHLAKYRSETDRLRSEYDKNAKTLAEQRAKIEAVLKAAKEDPEGTLRELGVDPEEFAERKLAARVKAALQAEEEKANPEKKAAREGDEEREKLRKENEELKAQQQKEKRDALMGRLRAAVEDARAKLPEAYRADATPHIIAVFRQALTEKRDISIEDASKAVLTLMRERARAAYEKDEDLRKLLGEKPKEPAKVLEHPAAKGAPRAADGKFKPADVTDGAGDVLQQIMRGKLK